MQSFRQAVERKDMDAVEALLADDVVFSSPVVFKTYTGKAITSAILRAVAEVFEDFTYEREFGAPDARDHALVFSATVAGKQLQGCDFLRLDEAGKIEELMVMVRPLSAANALAEAMGARFDAITRAAGGS